MPECHKCSKRFPNLIKIDGVVKNLSSRRYCLECSPFGRHNTKQIHVEKEKEKEETKDRPCRDCGSLNRAREPGCSVCYVCYNKRREQQKGDRLYGLTGEACWICGYDKGRQMLDFHHLLMKDFGLTIRNIGQLSFKRVLEEAKKCVLLCCRCHREVHAGMINTEDVINLHAKRWAEIDDRLG